jgi:hypothetical protein
MGQGLDVSLVSLVDLVFLVKGTQQVKCNDPFSSVGVPQAA